MIDGNWWKQFIYDKEYFAYQTGAFLCQQNSNKAQAASLSHSRYSLNSARACQVKPFPYGQLQINC